MQIVIAVRNDLIPRGPDVNASGWTDLEVCTAHALVAQGMRVLEPDGAYKGALHGLDTCMCLSVDCHCNNSKSGLKIATIQRIDPESTTIRMQRFKE